MKLVIGSRGSKLALVQSNLIADAIKKANPRVETEIRIIKTKGDIILDQPLNVIGDKGLFVKEIEEALLQNEIDLAVHSLKDMPAEQPEGLSMAVTPQREDPRDVLVTFHGEKSLKELPPRAVIATGSLRRGIQIKQLLNDVEVREIRGNVETRIKNSRENGYDGVILAAAGLNRLGLLYDGVVFSIEEMLPAPAQGILGLETRSGDKAVIELLKPLHHEESHRQALAERAFLRYIEGGCHAPMGVSCKIEGDTFTLRGFFQTETDFLAETVCGVAGEEADKGKNLALALRERM